MNVAVQSLDFFAPGIPRPKGSTKSFRHPKTGAIITMSDNDKTKPWQATVALSAEVAGAKMLDGPVSIHVEFLLPRPKGHFGKKGVRGSAPKFPTTKPDTDKLLRACLDALTGVCWRDDAQVILAVAVKVYAEGECGARVRVGAVELEEEGRAA